MLEVTGGAMATLIPANTNVDWPEYYLASNMALENLQQADMLVTQVCTPCFSSHFYHLLLLLLLLSSTVSFAAETLSMRVHPRPGILHCWS
jgi:hypothetical protein